jgi:hypothetical protein
VLRRLAEHFFSARICRCDASKLLRLGHPIRFAMLHHHTIAPSKMGCPWEPNSCLSQSQLLSSGGSGVPVCTIWSDPACNAVNRPRGTNYVYFCVRFRHGCERTGNTPAQQGFFRQMPQSARANLRRYSREFSPWLSGLVWPCRCARPRTSTTIVIIIGISGIRLALRSSGQARLMRFCFRRSARSRGAANPKLRSRI